MAGPPGDHHGGAAGKAGFGAKLYLVQERQAVKVEEKTGPQKPRVKLKLQRAAEAGQSGVKDRPGLGSRCRVGLHTVSLDEMGVVGQAVPRSLCLLCGERMLFERENVTWHACELDTEPRLSSRERK